MARKGKPTATKKASGITDPRRINDNEPESIMSLEIIVNVDRITALT